MKTITRCKKEEKSKTDMKDRKKYYESCKNWAAKMMAKEGFSKEDCIDTLRLEAEEEKAKIAYNSEYAITMAPIVGFLTLFVIFGLRIVANIIPQNSRIMYVILIIALPTVLIAVISIIFGMIDRKKRVESRDKIFMLERAAEYIEKNIP
ncbi:hypothetical protein [Acidithiobacillus sp.]|uniref:hypothetical protein n=1 Tax=Acidithiobacillus sp. TaxID=1872118 RepID=UPI0026023B1F|nr:hypothetical protein [Acidithiobacillus sp.]MDD5278788.1 hypothetical protein [Acidithiobacillus sp.]